MTIEAAAITESIWDIITTIATVIAASAAGVGLIFSGIQLRNNNEALRENIRTQQENSREQQESNRVRELQLLDNVLREIAELEKYKFETDLKNQGDDQFYKRWFQLFFNRIEYLSFLINNGFIRHPELATYVRGAIITWHEIYIPNMLHLNFQKLIMFILHSNSFTGASRMSWIRSSSSRSNRRSNSNRRRSRSRRSNEFRWIIRL
jgi:hypothetical protein